jgi:hypothetical protein
MVKRRSPIEAKKADWAKGLELIHRILMKLDAQRNATEPDPDPGRFHFDAVDLELAITNGLISPLNVARTRRLIEVIDRYIKSHTQRNEQRLEDEMENLENAIVPLPSYDDPEFADPPSENEDDEGTSQEPTAESAEVHTAADQARTPGHQKTRMGGLRLTSDKPPPRKGKNATTSMHVTREADTKIFARSDAGKPKQHRQQPAAPETFPPKAGKDAPSNPSGVVITERHPEDILVGASRRDHEAEAKAKAEADAKVEADAKAKAEADAKVEADAKAKAEADAKVSEPQSRMTLDAPPGAPANPGEARNEAVTAPGGGRKAPGRDYEVIMSESFNAITAAAKDASGAYAIPTDLLLLFYMSYCHDVLPIESERKAVRNARPFVVRELFARGKGIADLSMRADGTSEPLNMHDLRSFLLGLDHYVTLEKDERRRQALEDAKEVVNARIQKAAKYRADAERQSAAHTGSTPHAMSKPAISSPFAPRLRVPSRPPPTQVEEGPVFPSAAGNPYDSPFASFPGNPGWGQPMFRNDEPGIKPPEAAPKHRWIGKVLVGLTAIMLGAMTFRMFAFPGSGILSSDEHEATVRMPTTTIASPVAVSECMSVKIGSPAHRSLDCSQATVVSIEGAMATLCGCKRK